MWAAWGLVTCSKHGIRCKQTLWKIVGPCIKLNRTPIFCWLFSIGSFNSIFMSVSVVLHAFCALNLPKYYRHVFLPSQEVPLGKPCKTCSWHTSRSRDRGVPNMDEGLGQGSPGPSSPVRCVGRCIVRPIRSS